MTAWHIIDTTIQGFKNHCMSESHQRNMSHFSEHSGTIVRDNSKVFESSFVKLLSHRHGTKRIHSNLVYQEYIADRHHVHMSGTRWNSLRSFCYHLASQGTITVEENDKGVFITWYVVAINCVSCIHLIE